MDAASVIVVMVLSLIGAYVVIYFAVVNAIKDAANPPAVVKGFRSKPKVTDAA